MHEVSAKDYIHLLLTTNSKSCPITGPALDKMVHRYHCYNIGAAVETQHTLRVWIVNPPDWLIS